jgi:ubiquinone/menaquinone biosynthesis C-methylase UbiE
MEITHGGRPLAADASEERAYYSLSRRVYSVFAYFYDLVALPLWKVRRAVVAAAKLPAGAKVLDVATGTGAQALAFAESGCAVTGIDLSEAMLSMARRKRDAAKVTFQQADAAALPFADSGFDAACVSFALHEMPSSVRERVVREMARVTRPGGAVIVVDYAPPRTAHGSLAFRLVKLYEGEHYATFVRSDLDELLGSVGIEHREHLDGLMGLAKITIGQKAAD